MLNRGLGTLLFVDRSRSLSRPLVVAAVALSLFVAACTSSTDTTAATDPGGSSTTATTTTSVPESSPTTLPPTTVAVSASEGIPQDVVDELVDEIGELVRETEEVRGLPFLQAPAVAILDEEAFSQRVFTMLEEDLDEEELAVDGRLLQLLGMLDADTDYYTLILDLFTEQVAGFYDTDTQELVVPASTDGFSPLQRTVVVHELIHALTDQHFDLGDQLDEQYENGTGDDYASLQALSEGDATYFQFVYLEGMSPLQAVQAAAEALTIDTSVLDSVPGWMRADLTFPYDQGLTFVASQVDIGGIAGVDTAYLAPPVTTEQILDPSKYVGNELPVELPPLTVEVTGWDLYDEGSWGEWGLRMLFFDTLSPGMLTQTASGWGNDFYRVFSSGDDVATVIHYIGDTEQDAEEVANAFVVHLRKAMGAGGAVESGGGLLYNLGSIYGFVDRVDDEVIFVAATDKTVGADIRTQLGL